MLDDDLIGTNLLVVQTFDNNNFIFDLIKQDNLYYFKLFNDSRLITRIIIKPDLWIFFKDGGYEHGSTLLKPISNSKNTMLISNCFIDPDIFMILIDNNLISYSKGMADLYDLPVSYSRDIKYHKNDYKRTKNKELVLSKMKDGNFN